MLSRDFYPTWEEASKAARALGIKSAVEYAMRYKEDPRLPSAPGLKYPQDWVKNGRSKGFLGIRKSNK